MSKLLKKSNKLLRKIEDGKYVSAVIGLQDPDIIMDLHEITFKPDKSVTKEELEAVENILKVSKALYELNQYMSGFVYKLMPDEMYDRLIEKYKNITGGKEPFQSFIPSGMRSVEQDFPELSGTLDKVYEIYDTTNKPSLEKWLRKIMKELNVKKLKLLVTPKFDGTSVTVTYDKSESKSHIVYPVKALTRGDFERNLGVDLSNILKGVDSVYVTSTDFYNTIPRRFGVQYEAMITEYGRKRLSEVVGINYSTRRAAIASALKRLTNPKTTVEEAKEINKCITLVPLMVDNYFMQTFRRKMSLHDLMIAVNFNFYICDAENTLSFEIKSIHGDIDYLLSKFKEIVEDYVNRRNSMNYSIDGLVLTIDDYNHIAKLGRSSNKNKWQIAYKFDALTQRTRITGIIPTMGKQGFIGANITFEPIEFNGVRYEKAPVNNITRFRELDPHIGDEVIVSYNADVMGYIYKDETCTPSKNGEPLELPTHCIKCGEPLTVAKDMLKCVNDDCPGHKVGKILETIRIFDLDFFGEETANDLVDKAGISDTIEFIQMKYEDLAKVLKGLNLEKAWEEFQNKIKAPIEYPKVIDLLRIPSLRTKTAEKILEDIPINQLEEWMKTGNVKELYSALKKVKGIDKKADEFAIALVNAYEEFSQLKKLLNCVDSSGKEYNKVILVSGFRSNSEFDSICKKLNFKVIETGSKYDLLVVTPERLDGKKALQARKKGIPIMLLSEFIRTYS